MVANFCFVDLFWVVGLTFCFWVVFVWLTFVFWLFVYLPLWFVLFCCCVCFDIEVCWLLEFNGTYCLDFCVICLLLYLVLLFLLVWFCYLVLCFVWLIDLWLFVIVDCDASFLCVVSLDVWGGCTFVMWFGIGFKDFCDLFKFICIAWCFDLCFNFDCYCCLDWCFGLLSWAYLSFSLMFSFWLISIRCWSLVCFTLVWDICFDLCFVCLRLGFAIFIVDFLFLGGLACYVLLFWCDTCLLCGCFAACWVHFELLAWNFEVLVYCRGFGCVLWFAFLLFCVLKFAALLI